MNRRNFLKTSGLLSFASFSGISLISSSAHAVTPLASTQMFFKVALAVNSFINRKSDPTIPLLTSLANSLDAMNIKIDAINEKLDLILSETLKIRSLISDIPLETQLLNYTLRLREPYNAYLELNPNQNSNYPSESFLNNVPNIYERIQVARRLFIDASTIGTKNFEGVMHLAIAQDNELIVASEMLRTEFIELGRNVEPTAILNFLKEYEAFFKSAIDQNINSSIVSSKQHLLEKINLILNNDIEILPSLNKSWDYIEEPVYSSYRKLFEIGKWKAHCGVSSDPLCLKWFENGKGGYCAEPGHRHIYYMPISYKRSKLGKNISSTKDELNYPYLHEVISDMKCSNGNVQQNFYLNRDKKALSELNLMIANYYKFHYLHSVAELALKINQRQQRIISSYL